MTRSRTPSRRLAATVAATLTAFALCSCSAESDEPSGPESTATASGGTPSGSKSPSASSGAGETAALDGAQFTAPSGWYVKPEDGSYVIGAPDDADGFSPGSGIFNVGPTLAADVDQLAEAALSRVETAYEDGKRLPDVEYGGATFFHLRGTNGTERFDQYGAVVGESEVLVTWSFNPEWVTRDETDDLINQVMPSFKFEG